MTQITHGVQRTVKDLGRAAAQIVALMRKLGLEQVQIADSAAPQLTVGAGLQAAGHTPAPPPTVTYRCDLAETHTLLERLSSDGEQWWANPNAIRGDDLITGQRFLQEIPALIQAFRDREAELRQMSERAAELCEQLTAMQR